MDFHAGAENWLGLGLFARRTQAVHLLDKTLQKIHLPRRPENSLTFGVSARPKPLPHSSTESTTVFYTYPKVPTVPNLS